MRLRQHAAWGVAFQQPTLLVETGRVARAVVDVSGSAPENPRSPEIIKLTAPRPPGGLSVGFETLSDCQPSVLLAPPLFGIPQEVRISAGQAAPIATSPVVVEATRYTGAIVVGTRYAVIDVTVVDPVLSPRPMRVPPGGRTTLRISIARQVIVVTTW